MDNQKIQVRIKRVLGQHKNSKHARDYDDLTGLYNKNMFLRITKEMLSSHEQEQFIFIRMDINQFQLLNQLYGFEEGDRLLKYIARLLTENVKHIPYFTYGRYRADVFCICTRYKGENDVLQFIDDISIKVNQYPLSHVIVPVFGLYVIENNKDSVDAISDKANYAAKHCKGNYIKNYAFYDASMNAQLLREQKIINSMQTALDEEQFVLYIQPKYDLHTNMVDGGEVLVRWMVPGQGMVPPSDFIPVFERNGFIMKLDFYVWEHTCKIIRRWLDEGKTPYPLSVNISRVSLSNPKLAQIIHDLVEKYRIAPSLLQLELTESAYTKNPSKIKNAMQQLQKYGFCILMDDFGSGYSSLNTLKDISVDILKIDMKFLSDSDMPGRSENILASVVRMAKWLDMPVIAEGVEKESQVAFLRSIGCEFVQGYYFSKPMPVEEYEYLAFNDFPFHKEESSGTYSDANRLWDVSSQMEILFSNMLQAVAIYEYVLGKKTIEAIRVNNAFYDLFGYHGMNRIGGGILDIVVPNYREIILNAFEAASCTKGIAQCEFHYTQKNGKEIWIEMKLKYVNSVGDRSVIFAVMSDITDQKEIERELRGYRKAILSSESRVETILIVDDIEMNRKILRGMFESEYIILEACNGLEALETVRKNCHHIDLILLDVMMPVMDGKEFLKKKNEDTSIAEIPVVIVTSDDSAQQQINALSMGANDYVVKPFIPEVVIRRVCNVLESQKRVGKVFQKTDTNQPDRHDVLTGLYSKYTAGQMIREVLQNTSGLQALLMVDIDNFTAINEQYGTKAGDKLITDLANHLQSSFRKSDILSRYGGDEFIIFVMDVPSLEFIQKKCDALLHKVNREMDLECSIGVAVIAAENGQDNFMTLISHADQALYDAKHKGKNQWCMYEENN